MVPPPDYPGDKWKIANCWLTATKKNAKSEDFSKEATTNEVYDDLTRVRELKRIKPRTPEMHLAITKLQECRFWLHEHIWPNG